MKKLAALVIAFFSMVASYNCYSATPRTIQDIAEILINIDHTANVNQKKLLKELSTSDSITLNEQRMAKAVLNLDKTIRPEDKALIWAVLRDITAGEAEKELAKIILRFDTLPTENDLYRLNKLLKN